jgi:phosphopantetheine--protein transferase-like protein
MAAMSQFNLDTKSPLMPNELPASDLLANESLANELLTSEVHLYLLPLAAINSSQSQQLLECLSDDEQAKVARYQPKSRNNALIVRAGLRHVLSLHSALSHGPSHTLALHSTFSPEQWQFDYGKQGKPELTAAQYAQTGLNFNLSHSGDWLLIAVLQAPAHSKVLQAPTHSKRYALGVDIERRRDSTNIHTILKRYFAEAEITDLLALDASKQRDRFFDLWALKESYIKACGKGLAMVLASFSFDINAALHLQNSENSENTSSINKNTDNTSSTSSINNNSSQGPKIHSLSLDDLFSFSSAESGVMSVNYPDRVSADIDYSPAQQVVMTRLNQAQSHKEALDEFAESKLAESQLTKGQQLNWLSVPLQHSLNQELDQELDQAGSSEKAGMAADNSWHSYLAQLDEQYRIAVSVSL